jgi:hypothetical protein
MAIKISPEQAPKTPGGEPIEYLFIDSIVLIKNRQTNKWSVKVQYVQAMKMEDGSYLPFRNQYTLTIPKFDDWALAQYIAGHPEAANADAALQIALAQAIAQNNPMFSSAYYETPE